jgi:hypothetical protein
MVRVADIREDLSRGAGSRRHDSSIVEARSRLLPEPCGPARIEGSRQKNPFACSRNHLLRGFRAALFRWLAHFGPISNDPAVFLSLRGRTRTTRNGVPLLFT